jgi:hypothetical protein
MGAYAMMAGVRMEHRLICETFDRQTLHPCLKWFNPPPSWRVDAVRSRMLAEPGAETDFWQRTHYGFRADSGHFSTPKLPVMAHSPQPFSPCPCINTIRPD